MQADLVDATQWTIDQGIAGAEAITINGFHASAMGLLRDPGLFKAGIIEHASWTWPINHNTRHILGACITDCENNILAI